MSYYQVANSGKSSIYSFAVVAESPCFAIADAEKISATKLQNATYFKYKNATELLRDISKSTIMSDQCHKKINLDKILAKSTRTNDLKEAFYECSEYMKTYEGFDEALFELMTQNCDVKINSLFEDAVLEVNEAQGD